MNRIISFKSKAPYPKWLKAEVQQREIIDQVQGIFESWSYVPLGLHTGKKKPLLKEIPSYMSLEDLPLRCWMQSSSERGCQMSAFFIGEKSLDAQAEMIALSVEVLKKNHLRHLTLTLGSSLFHDGFLKAFSKEKGEAQLSALKGSERILRSAEVMTESDSCHEAIEQLRELSKKIRGFGVKEQLKYDLALTLPQLSGPLLFKCEYGLEQQPLISGGQQRVSAPDGQRLHAIEFEMNIKDVYQQACSLESFRDFYVSDFLVISRKKTLRSTFEIVKVLREQSYSVAMDYSEKSKEDLLNLARRQGVLNLLIVGDSDSERNEVTLVDVLDTLSLKVKISDVFDPKSGFRKMLRYQKRLESQ